MTPHLPIIADNFRAMIAHYRDRVAAGECRVILTRHSRPVAALVSIVDLKRWEARDVVEGVSK